MSLRTVRSMRRRIGVLTGGGDCPGLNAALRAIVRHATSAGIEVVGYKDAWRGVEEGDATILDEDDVRSAFNKGGTLLGTARGGPYDHHGAVERVLSTLVENRVDGVIVVGGNGSLALSERLWREDGVRVLGVPKSIDNDVPGSDVCIGFSTAVQTATEAVERLHTTAESHHRVMLVEVMGRDAGWIAAHTAIAGGACAVMLPERDVPVEETARAVMRRGGGSRVVVVAEGCAELRRHGGLAGLAERFRECTGGEVRTVSLGHVLRGGAPNAGDRVLATRLGAAAFSAAWSGEWGRYVVLDGATVRTAPLREAVGTRRLDDATLELVARALF